MFRPKKQNMIEKAICYGRGPPYPEFVWQNVEDSLLIHILLIGTDIVKPLDHSLLQVCANLQSQKVLKSSMNTVTSFQGVIFKDFISKIVLNIQSVDSL